METAQLEKFMEAQRGAVTYLKSFPHRGAAIVHHNDTDGIASGAILKEALRREGYRTENIPIERVHPAFLPRIHTKERKIILYADLGSQAGSLISGRVREGTGVIILDHHPPFHPSFSRFIQVNPESFGIDGDLQASAASVAFFWARTLNEKNEDLAYLGVIGAIGDYQVVEGKMAGLNQMALEMARQKGALDPSPRGAESFRFPLFKGRSGSEVSGEITNLAVNGYYRGGAELALNFCLEGPTEESQRLAAEVKEIQEDRFRREVARIRNRGISCEGEVQWADVEGRFYPLGLKSIGLFCEEMIREAGVHADRYIAGFQDFPRELPLLGRFKAEDTKVSMRVPPALRQEIENGKKPNLAELLPPAAEKAGGFAEGVHRFAAACTVPKNRKMDLIQALNAIIREWAEGRG
jgi:single-stranded DNA-specific DHH superfamily exonuclease